MRIADSQRCRPPRHGVRILYGPPDFLTEDQCGRDNWWAGGSPGSEGKRQQTAPATTSAGGRISSADRPFLRMSYCLTLA